MDFITELKESLYKVDNNAVADEMNCMLTDPEVSTYDMYEDLVNAYVNGNDDVRKGMDLALRALTWYDMHGVYNNVKDCLKEEECE